MFKTAGKILRIVLEELIEYVSKMFIRKNPNITFLCLVPETCKEGFPSGANGLGRINR
jgi:hypothetical protein